MINITYAIYDLYFLVNVLECLLVHDHDISVFYGNKAFVLKVGKGPNKTLGCNARNPGQIAPGYFQRPLFVLVHSLAKH